MSTPSSQQNPSDFPALTDSKTKIDPYLNRLYFESRQTLLKILLGTAKTTPTEADTLKNIQSLIEDDPQLDRCRERIGEYFPGRLARLFNLVGEDDKPFVIEDLRTSIQDHKRRLEESSHGQPLEDADLKALEELKKSSKLQQQLAYLVNYTPGKWLLEQEIPVVLESRKRRLGSNNFSPKEDESAPIAEQCAEASVTYSKESDSYEWSRDHGRFRGLCLSGGGIRSATFNLGILQGLAKRNLLRRFDYLSSVSGGGYISQWLAAWIKREEPSVPSASGSPGLDAVCQRLIPLPDDGCTHVHPEPIRWLRRYSNYLTPQTGFLSADLWVTIAIWARNTFLNQLILISGLLSMLLIPHLFLINKISSALTKIDQSPATASGLPLSVKLINILILLLLAIGYILPIRNLAAGLSASRQGRSCVERVTNIDLCVGVVLPFLIACIVISDFGFYFALPGLTQMQQVMALCAFTFLGVLILNLSLTWAGGDLWTGRKGTVGSTVLRMIGFFLAGTLAASVCAGCIFLARNTFVTGSPFQFEASAIAQTSTASGNTNSSLPSNQASQGASAKTSTSKPAYQEPNIQWLCVVTLGPFVVILISFLGIILHCGLIGRYFDDSVLEWLGRVRAWTMIYSLVWTAAIGISLFGHQVVHLLVTSNYSWIKWPAVGGWILTTVGSVLAGKSKSTSSDTNVANTPLYLRILTLAGPPVYILGLLLLLSWAASEMLFWAAEIGTVAVLCVVALPVILFVLFGWRVDVNEFSMHSYYRNRLARCYLGASQTERNPDPLTGFDTKDVEGLQVSKFQPQEGYSGPLPIFCATMNISVGEDLAWQERKAASFFFSPVLSGYYVPWTGSHHQGKLSYNGFVPTERFAYGKGGIHISTAAAISGAAISPNCGYHTNPAMAFLLTMFNVRLGWWMENPRRSYLAFNPAAPLPKQHPYPTPRFAPAQLVQELLGQIGDDRKFVYLTDGGHFENMGLYELVRRRCYEIVICDAEEDIGPTFEGMGMAIRKCRLDFGAEISLDLAKLATDTKTKLSKTHWITGTIKYPETGNAEPGHILYIKSSITGSETADVYNYRKQHGPFPQDSTTDQWFSESQFESYRRLGQQIVDDCPFLA